MTLLLLIILNELFSNLAVDYCPPIYGQLMFSLGINCHFASMDCVFKDKINFAQLPL